MLALLTMRYEWYWAGCLLCPNFSVLILKITIKTELISQNCYKTYMRLLWSSSLSWYPTSKTFGEYTLKSPESLCTVLCLILATPWYCYCRGPELVSQHPGMLAGWTSTTCNSSSRRSAALFWTPWASALTCTHNPTHIYHIYTITRNLKTYSLSLATKLHPSTLVSFYPRSKLQSSS